MRKKGPNDMSGRRVGRLVVTKECRPTRVTRTVWQWKCQCSCGRETWVSASQLVANKTKSCGCLVSDSASRTKTTHGRTGTREYSIWAGMWARCRDTDNPRYGARGIRVCDRWRQFETFLEDMGEAPTDAPELDRINNDGNYEPGNCRWADKKTNCRNRSHSRMLTYKGETATVEDWAERLSLPTRSLRSRLALGWDTDRALTTPFLGRAGANKARRTT